jgi:hypothetical protein
MCGVPHVCMQVGVVRVLLEHGAQVDARDYMFRNTPLILASCRGHVDVVEVSTYHADTSMHAFLHLGTTPQNQACIPFLCVLLFMYVYINLCIYVQM